MSVCRGRLSYAGEVLLTFEFTSFAGGLQLLIAGGKDGGLAVGQAVRWSDIAQGAVEAGGVIVLDELADDAFGVGEGERGFGGEWPAL